MEDWNQVHATVSIDGENRSYTPVSYTHLTLPTT